MTLPDLYYEMLRLRLIEEKIADLYQEQEMRCPVHLSIGQEAVAVGVCAALEKTDYVLSTHRSHGHYIAKGGDIPSMLAEIYGKATGCAQGKGGSMHLTDLEKGFIGATPIVGSTIAIAVGTAFGSQLKKENKVTVVFFGEGATEEGVFHESVNFAVLKNLPIVFVCENNLYSVYSPMSVRQPSNRTVSQVAGGHGIETKQADGNDVEAVLALTKPAIDKARRGAGPTFLEFPTYRWREHCGPNYDNHIGYRTEEEFEQWKKLCPIEKVITHNGVSHSQDREMRFKISKEIESAVNFAKSSPLPKMKTASENVYAR